MSKKPVNESELEKVNGGWGMSFENNVITFTLDEGENPVTAAIDALTRYEIDYTPYLGMLGMYAAQMKPGVKYIGAKIYLSNVNEKTKTASIDKVEFLEA